MSCQSLAPSNLGKRETLDSLSDEFKFNRSFGEKVRELQAKGYTGWRRMRGDGNCFYRSVGFGWLEEILKAPRKQQRAQAQVLLHKLEALNFESPEEGAAHQRLCAHARCLASGAGWQDAPGSSQGVITQLELLEASFMDPALDSALVRAVRSVIGKYLLANADDETVCNGISFRVLCSAQGQGSPEDFCRTTVFKMGVEAETQIIRATVQALGIGLQIVLLDRAGDTKLCFESYEVIGDEGVDHLTVHVQLRPGHYDLIYWNVPRADANSDDSQDEVIHDVVDECQKYSCRDCGWSFLWGPNDKPNVRCEQCGHSICVLCLAEASGPRSLFAMASGLLPNRTGHTEFICPHVAAQLEVQDHELSSLKAQLEPGHVAEEQEREALLEAITGLEEQFQEQYDENRLLQSRCQELEQTLQNERATPPAEGLHQRLEMQSNEDPQRLLQERLRKERQQQQQLRSQNWFRRVMRDFVA